MSAVGRGGRPGFALLAVLWVMVAAAALASTIALAARESVATARNRISATRAMWRAHDCLERARAAIDETLHDAAASTLPRTSPWLVLDSAVARSGLAASLPCGVELRPSGMAVDVNSADAEMLRKLLRAAAIGSARADSMADALLDWRDADDTPRAFGAERSWYTDGSRAPPRNAAFAADREVTFVRGFDVAWGLDSLLSVESARILLSRAPLPVISALPGMGEEAIARVAERRVHGPWPTELLALTAELSPAARATLLAHYSELTRLTIAEPEAWIATSSARDDASAVTAVIEARLVRAGTRAAIVRRRSWIE